MMAATVPCSCFVSAATAVQLKKPYLRSTLNPSLFSISPSSSPSSPVLNRSAIRVRAFLFNPAQEPILKEAFKEPVAFLGGMFAGLLRLDLNDEPLKEWVTRTVEASGITDEDIKAQESNEEQVPEQIEIE